MGRLRNTDQHCHWFTTSRLTGHVRLLFTYFNPPINHPPSNPFFFSFSYTHTRTITHTHSTAGLVWVPGASVCLFLGLCIAFSFRCESFVRSFVRLNVRQGGRAGAEEEEEEEARNGSKGEVRVKGEKEKKGVEALLCTALLAVCITL